MLGRLISVFEFGLATPQVADTGAHCLRLAARVAVPVPLNMKSSPVLTTAIRALRSQKSPPLKIARRQQPRLVCRTLLQHCARVLPFLLVATSPNCEGGFSSMRKVPAQLQPLRLTASYARFRIRVTHSRRLNQRLRRQARQRVNVPTSTPQRKLQRAKVTGV